FFLIIHRLPIYTLFPYTTLFRSIVIHSYHVTGCTLLLTHTYQTRAASTRCTPSLPQRLRRSPHARGYGRQPPTPHVDSPMTRYQDRKSTRLNSSHVKISYAVFCL